MKIIIRAGGIIRLGPEHEMVQDYVKRANGLARSCGFLGLDIQSLDLSKCKTRAAETQQLLAAVPPGAPLIIMDERGKDLTSRQIARRITDWRDDGHSAVHILIGGADGFEPDSLPKGVMKWRFGQQTWPHKLVRVMLTEQLYRALSILNGSPYHRD